MDADRSCALLDRARLVLCIGPLPWLPVCDCSSRNAARAAPVRAGRACSPRRCCSPRLIAIGAYGLYWLIDGVLLAEGRRTAGGRGSRWSFRSRWSATARRAWCCCCGRTRHRRERRAAVVQKATEWELPGGQATAGRPVAAGRAADRRGDRQPRRAAGLSLADRRGFRLGVVHDGRRLPGLEHARRHLRLCK